VLEKVMSDETVPAGEMVMTSGGDGIFPKGLLVGRVTKVGAGSDLFLNIRVRPAADLSRLEEVLVVTKIDERQAQPEQTGAARAVDILAERLPSVPAKPPENGEKGATPESVAPTPGSDAKPKAVPPAASAGSASPAAVKLTKPAPVAGTAPAPSSGKPSVPKANASGGDAVKVSPKKVSPELVPPAVAPKPQSPAQDSPQ
jgi:rod shape-determining protein MreC